MIARRVAMATVVAAVVTVAAVAVAETVVAGVAVATVAVAVDAAATEVVAVVIVAAEAVAVTGAAIVRPVATTTSPHGPVSNCQGRASIGGAPFFVSAALARRVLGLIPRRRQ